MEALVALKAEGVIRSIGIGVQDHDLHRQAVDSGHLDVCMMVNDYTLLRQNADDIFALAEARGLGLVNGAALAMGLLSGRDPESVGTERWTPPAAEVQAAKQVHTWCDERGIPVLALALQFSLQQPRFDCTLVGVQSKRGCCRLNWRARARTGIPRSSHHVWTCLAAWTSAAGGVHRSVPTLSGSRPERSPMARAAPLTRPSPRASARAKMSSAF